MVLTLLFLGALLLGSIPFGFVVCHLKGIDIRKVGSGNIGATNVKRALGSKWGVFVFVLDALKGVAPGVVGGLVFAAQPELTGSLEPAAMRLLLGMTAIVGHVFSPFVGFKGGKGVATGLGALLGSVPLVGISAFGLFLVVIVITQFMSIASLAAAFSLPVFALLYNMSGFTIGILSLIGLMVVIRHLENIKRLIKRTEPKFSMKSKKEANETGGSEGLDSEGAEAESLADSSKD